jgi:subtilisin family serine protease
MSLGGSFKSRTEERAFKQSDNRGVLSVAAAGNDGSGSPHYPASYRSVLSVGAVDSSMTVASFSQRNSQVELAAPGVGVLSTVPWIEENSLTAGGTSYTGNYIENAARTDGNGAGGSLADGGLCTSSGSWNGQVVLCERGSISFFDKVTNVQSGGGTGAVIYNNAAGNFLGTLGAGNSSNIPAISLSQVDGQAALGQTGSASTVVSQSSNPASGYEAWNGTSMATPHVSGVAALVWSHHTECTNDEIRGALTSTALDLGDPGRDNSYGFGLVQAADALAHLDANLCGDGGTTDPPPGGGCNLGQKGDPCSSGSDCCSGGCKGKPGAKTCK